MDYSVILSEILSLLTDIREILAIIAMLGSISFLYVFIRNLIKIN